jgi:signal peptidase II
MRPGGRGGNQLTVKNKHMYLLVSMGIIVLDQISKWLVKSNLALYQKIDVIPGFFQIRHIQNRGAVWGLFSNTSNSVVPKVITAMSIFALLFIFYYFLKVDRSCRLELASFSLIMGGALGNIVDRLWQGFVVDFLEFHIGTHYWPTFNVADSCISCGVALLVLALWRKPCPAVK